MAALDHKSGIAQRFGELRLDALRLGACDVLQMECRAGQYFDAPPKHAAGSTDAGFVLIETLRRRVATHADVYAMRTATPVCKIEQHEVAVGAPGPCSADSKRPLVERPQPLHVVHRQPLGDRSRGAVPQR